MKPSIRCYSCASRGNCLCCLDLPPTNNLDHFAITRKSNQEGVLVLVDISVAVAGAPTDWPDALVRVVVDDVTLCGGSRAEVPWPVADFGWLWE